MKATETPKVKFAKIAKAGKNKKMSENIAQFFGPKTTAQSNAEGRMKIGNTKKKDFLTSKLNSVIGRALTKSPKAPSKTKIKVNF